MKRLARLAAVGILACAHHTASMAGVITTYTIDPNRSYVSAYVPDNKWVSLDYWSLSDTYWGHAWKLARFSLSGSFDLETEQPSYWNTNFSRLNLRSEAISTNAPAYAEFGLPDYFAQQDEYVSYSSNPCFDEVFYSIGGSCWWASQGIIRWDDGTLRDGVLNIEGVADDNWWEPDPYIVKLPFGVKPDSNTPIDYSAMTGRFRYHLVALSDGASVPEPGTVSLILGGLGLMGFMARRRKK